MTKVVGTVRQRAGKTVYFLDGVEVTKAKFDATFPSRLKELLSGDGPGVEVNTLHRSACWPMESQAMGVHPRQVAKENERLRAAGSKCYHRRNGKLVIPSQGERKKVMKLKAMRDNNAFN